jgi:hypothetical protein
VDVRGVLPGRIGAGLREREDEFLHSFRCRGGRNVKGRDGRTATCRS